MTYIYIIWETADMGVKPGGPAEHCSLFGKTQAFAPSLVTDSFSIDVM